LASSSSNAPVSLISISERRNISVSYLEQLFSKLRKQNIVKSIRGPSLWNSLDEVWYSYLSAISLQQLVDLHQQDGAEVNAVTASRTARNENPTTAPRKLPSSRRRIAETLAAA